MDEMDNARSPDDAIPVIPNPQRNYAKVHQNHRILRYRQSDKWSVVAHPGTSPGHQRLTSAALAYKVQPATGSARQRS